MCSIMWFNYIDGAFLVLIGAERTSLRTDQPTTRNTVDTTNAVVQGQLKGQRLEVVSVFFCRPLVVEEPGSREKLQIEKAHSWQRRHEQSFGHQTAIPEASIEIISTSQPINISHFRALASRPLNRSTFRHSTQPLKINGTSPQHFF